MPRWTPESRLKQSQRIREWQPWEKSTGPVTEEGKKTSSKNKSPTDYVVLPGVGLVREDTKAGRLAIAQYEQRWQYERESLKRFGEVLPSYSDLKKALSLGENE